MRRLRRFAPTLLLVTVACGGIGETGLDQFAAGRDTGETHDTSAQTVYRLAAGDRVRVKVFGEPDVTGEYDVGSSGAVSLPLAGEISADGLTTVDLERAITRKLAAGIVRQPRVNVEVATYRPFYIRGEVKKAGDYPFKPGLTVADAVAMAGGFTYRANESKVFVRRSGESRERQLSLQVAVPVFPGDNIRVPERYF